MKADLMNFAREMRDVKLTAEEAKNLEPMVTQARTYAQDPPKLQDCGVCAEGRLSGLCINRGP